MQVISSSDLCRALSISKHTLFSWISRGILKPPGPAVEHGPLSRSWTLEEFVLLALFVRAQARKSSLQDCAGLAEAMYRPFGDFLLGRITGDRLIFYTARRASDGAESHGYFLEPAALTAHLQEALKKGFTEFFVSDLTETASDVAAAWNAAVTRARPSARAAHDRSPAHAR